MIRVLICDDQAIARQGLQMILSTAPDITVVGAVQDGQEALDTIADTQPDEQPNVVLMDLKMPRMNGVQATRAIHERFPNVRVLVLTTYDADEWVFDAVRSGANGYLLKDAPPNKLLEAIRDTASGRTPVDSNVAGKVFSQVARKAPIAESQIIHELSDREIEVLRLIARGFTNAEIALHVHLSEGTIRNYISTILSKLGVHDRTQAAVEAIRYGLIDLNEV